MKRRGAYSPRRRVSVVSRHDDQGRILMARQLPTECDAQRIPWLRFGAQLAVQDDRTFAFCASNSASVMTPCDLRSANLESCSAVLPPPGPAVWRT
jgi:hypothetical protein